MPRQKAPPLKACDVLNWNYLVELSAEYDHDESQTDFRAAMVKLAYELTQTADEEIRTSQLAEFLHKLTDHTSKDSCEEMIAEFSRHFRCKNGQMRKFAKENGIKLKRLKLW